MSRVVCFSEVCAGAATPLMTSHELRDICCSQRLAPVTYVEMSVDGSLPVAAAGARLAPHLPARTLLLSREGGAGGAARGWRVRCEGGARAGDELRLWFDEDLLAAARLPFLTPNNILGKKNYMCHECGEQFEEPNPLKLHLFLSCKQFSAERFWNQLVRRVEQSEPAPPCPPRAWVGGLQAEALAAWWARAAPREGGRHRCLYCGKVYSRAYGLKIHVRTHTGYKPLRCPHCGRPFGDPSNLNKHVRLHGGRGDGRGGQHSCGGCGRGHARRRDLLRHERDCTHSATPLHAHSGADVATEL